MGQDFLGISAIFSKQKYLNHNTNVIANVQSCFCIGGIVQMCTSCPGPLSRRDGTISTPLYSIYGVMTLSRTMQKYCK